MGQPTSITTRPKADRRAADRWQQANGARSASDRQATLSGRSRLIRELEIEISYAIRSDANVLITGEEGAGKATVARAIHWRSSRSGAPFLSLNCAGMSDRALLSQLFGSAAPEASGVVPQQRGLLWAANEGTLLIENVDQIRLSVQSLLSRFLATRDVFPVGADPSPSRLDVRVIATSPRPLDDRLPLGEFCDRLYYRVNVIHLVVPPLRERPEDIPELIDDLLAAAAVRHGVAPPRLSPDAIAGLMSYGWPGNTGQLKRLIDRLVVSVGPGVITSLQLGSDVASV